MKYPAPLPSAALLASLALVTPSVAQDAPNPPAPEPAVEIEAAPAPAADLPAAPDEAKGEVKPYLGLGACAVPGFLGKHLNLPPDSGVMVRSLDPDGPAAKAGFTVDDVITKVAGKAVASHREMVDCFLTKTPGDEIAIDFIHEGKPGTRSVKLGERSAAQAAAPNPARGGGPEINVLEGQLNLPNGLGGIGGLGGLGGGLAPQLQKQMRDAMDQALKNGGNQMRLQIIPGGAGGVQIIPGGGDAKFGVASSVRMMDEQGGTIELKTVDGGSEVRVTDRAGKELWSGAWDTEQDKAAAPPDIRKRIERLNIMQPPQPRAQLPEPDQEDEDAAEAPKPAAPEQVEP